MYPTVIAVCLTSFRLLGWDVRVTGIEHVPTVGPAVVASNHVSYLDFVFSGYGVRQRDRRRLRFVAKREVFDHPVTGPLMRAMGHIPVDRGGDARVALREVGAALAAGDLVGMFPEGTISTSFVPLDGRAGAARMAMDADAPLVPAAIWGTQRIFTKGRSLRPAPGTCITISFGSPIAYGPHDTPAQVHERLMASIRDLVDHAQRTYPQRPAGPDDAWWQPAHLGGRAPSVDEARERAQAEARERRRRRRDG